MGYPQGVAGDHVDLAADLLDLGVGVDVVAEQGRVDLDVVGRRDGVDLGLVPVVAPGHPVERARRRPRWERPSPGRRVGAAEPGAAVGAAVGAGGRGRRTGGEDATRADGGARGGSHLEELSSAVFAHQISHSTLLASST